MSYLHFPRHHFYFEVSYGLMCLEQSQKTWMNLPQNIGVTWGNLGQFSPVTHFLGSLAAFKARR